MHIRLNTIVNSEQIDSSIAVSSCFSLSKWLLSILTEYNHPHFYSDPFLLQFQNHLANIEPTATIIYFNFADSKVIELTMSHENT